jgi:hypothetical protein
MVYNCVYYYDTLTHSIRHTVPFSVDWPSAEWARKETWIYERFARLKTLSAQRDLKIIVCVIRIGQGVPDKVYCIALKHLVSQ